MFYEFIGSVLLFYEFIWFTFSPECGVTAFSTSYNAIFKGQMLLNDIDVQYFLVTTQ